MRQTTVFIHRAASTHPLGFTLLELMMTLSVSTVLIGLAVPAFGELWLDSQRTTVVNEFVHSIYLARTVALQRGRTVAICPSDDGTTCKQRATDWHHGWIVFVNNDRDQPPVRDSDETVLAASAAWPRGTITSNRSSYSFRPIYNGVVNGSLVFCDRRGAPQARAIIINYAGRPRVSRRDSDNRPLRCPGR